MRGQKVDGAITVRTIVVVAVMTVVDVLTVITHFAVSRKMRIFSSP